MNQQEFDLAIGDVKKRFKDAQNTFFELRPNHNPQFDQDIQSILADLLHSYEKLLEIVEQQSRP